MLLVGSALKGYAIEANDGSIGHVSDFLFDDTTWKLRWLVVEAGSWLSERKVLIHPSAIGKPDYERSELPVNLTREKVKQSPDIMQDPPVSRQMESHLYDYYGWDPLWGGGSYFGAGLMAYPLSSPPYFGGAGLREAEGAELAVNDGDPHLRSMEAVSGYHIHASDGAMGHLENFLIDDAQWSINYFIVDTSNWWIGQHVMISPYAVREIGWSEREIFLNVTREQVKTSPKWDPLQAIDEIYEKRLHGHYGWPGYGW